MIMTVSCLLLPEMAHAGCGDYDMATHPAEMAKRLGHAKQSPSLPVCHGPHCSKSPEKQAPFESNPFRFSLPSDLIGTRLGQTDLDQNSHRYAIALTNLLPEITLTDIFHPPR